MGLRMANLAILVLFASLGAVTAQYSSPAPAPAPTPEMPSSDSHSSPQSSNPGYISSPAAAPTPGMTSSDSPSSPQNSNPSYITPAATPAYPSYISSPAVAPAPEMPNSTPHTPQITSPSYISSPAAAPTPEMPSSTPHIPQSFSPSYISSPAVAPSPEMPSSTPHTPQSSSPSYISSPAPAPTLEVPSSTTYTPQSSSPSYIGSPAAAPTQGSPQSFSPNYIGSPAASPSLPSPYSSPQSFQDNSPHYVPAAAPSNTFPSLAPVPSPQDSFPSYIGSPAAALTPGSPPSFSPSYIGSPATSPSLPSPYSSPQIFQDNSPHHAPAAAPSYTFPRSAPVPSPQGSFPSYIPPVAAPTPSPPSTTTPSPPRPTPPSARLTLKVGFYKRSCPQAEKIIREAVRSATSKNPGIGAGIIRLHFHDCFVQGCDASILLDPTPANPQPEKLSPPNFPSLRGFEVIDVAKEALEKVCPGKVSCADIIAFASRDASFFLSRRRINFQMPAGRLDGRVSLSSEALNFLPPPFFNLSQLIANFKAKNLDEDDLVVLSGAHTIGVSHCSSFRRGFPSDIDPAFANLLQSQCPLSPNIANDPTVVQDIMTPNQLDTRYYTNVLKHNVLFASDAALLSSQQTSIKVLENAFIPKRWETKFAKAMVKMAAIELKTAANGEIRRMCRVINN